MNESYFKTEYLHITIIVIFCLATIAVAYFLTGVVSAQQTESDKLMSEVITVRLNSEF